MGLPLFQVDAFTDRPFSGNPAGVCLLAPGSLGSAGPAEEGWMQKVAAEMNLSETAFLSRAESRPDPAGVYHLRWFTPVTEVDLCGHATLAAAHVLWEIGEPGAGEGPRFLTLSGELAAARREAGWIELDFPAEPAQAVDPPAELREALGVEAAFVGRNRLDYLVEVASPAEVRGLDPDLELLAYLGERGVMVTSVSDLPGYDFISRFFAPGVGIDEDPVTGSAHCCLGPYWAGRLGRSQLSAYQASRRGGSLRLRVEGDRVRLSGQAVTVFRGELREGPG